MKIYELFVAEGNKVGYFSEETSSMTLSELSATWRKYKNDNNLIEDWRFVHFKVDDKLNKGKRDANVIRHNIGFFITDEYSKNLLEKHFDGIVQFLPVTNDDDTENHYYQLYPVMAIDVLDVEKSECSFMSSDSNWVDVIYKYVFYDKAEFLPIFKLRCNGHVDSHNVWVTDEFKDFVEANNITGFNFIEVYDSETVNSAKETLKQTKIPDDGINSFGKFGDMKYTLDQYRIPMTHENGVFTPAELDKTDQSSGKCLTIQCLNIEHGGSMIINSGNRYIVRDDDNCYMAKDFKVTYRSGRLQSVYIISGGQRIPVYICFLFSLSDRGYIDFIKRKIIKTVIECIELCGEDLMNQLRNGQTPVKPLSIEGYYISEHYMNINLQDGENVYTIGSAASNLLRCICNCAGELRIPDNYNYGNETFKSILEGLHEKLSKEIPKRFEVTADFQVCEPVMRDSKTYNSAKETAMKKQMIPMVHENGIFKLSSIEVPEGDSLTFELNGDCILSGNNDYIVYGVRECNVPECTEITYQDGKLFSVYINTENGKLPVYLTFDFSGSKEPETLGQAINECIEACCNDFINALERAEKPLCPVAVEYYYDGEQMNINLQDENNRIYNVKTAADHMVRCTCICAGEQCPDNNRMNYETFKRILNGLYKKLSEDIPKRFEVSDDFKLYEPEEVD